MEGRFSGSMMQAVNWMNRRGGHWLQVTGRIKPGVSMTQVQAELDAIGARLAKEFPAENGGGTIRMVPLPPTVGGHGKSPLFPPFGAVRPVLPIPCAHIAHLLLPPPPPPPPAITLPPPHAP